MQASPWSHPCSSQRHLGPVVSAACTDVEICRWEEPQFPKWVIYGFLGYRTSWRVSKVGLVRTCHKGEPKRLRLRIGESQVRGEEGPREYLDGGTLGCTELPSEELLCLRNKDGCQAYETLGRCRNEAGCGEQGQDKGVGPLQDQLWLFQPRL